MNMKKDKYVILSILNLYMTNRKTVNYEYESEYDVKSEKQITGYVSNEPGIKQAIYEIKNVKEANDVEVYALSSKKVLEEEKNDGEKTFTTRQYIEEVITEYGNENGVNVSFKDYEETLPESLDYKTILKMSVDITNYFIELSKEYDVHLYIEANGGQRDFISVISAIVQTAKQYVTIEKAIGVNGVENVWRIADKTNAFQITDFYSGVDEFVNYGRTGKLDEFFDTIKEKVDLSKEAKAILKAINNVSEAFVLCYPTNMVDEMKNLSDTLDRYNKSNNKIEIMNYLAQKVQNAYIDIFDSIKKSNNAKMDFNVIKNLINYCLKHNLIPQALTLFNERMPIIVADHKIIYPKTKAARQDFVEYLIKSKKKINVTDLRYIYIIQYITVKPYNYDLPSTYEAYLPSVKYKNRFKTELLRGTQDKRKLQQSIVKLLESGIIGSDVEDNDKAAQIIKFLSIIRDYRNRSNHAQDKREDCRTSLKTIKETIALALSYIEEFNTTSHNDYWQSMKTTYNNKKQNNYRR